MKGKNPHMNEDEAPSLKLTMLKGPLSGQVLDFKPRSVIRIGRVVRGNTFAIKDDGISSKHLVIQFDSGSGRWTVTDLDSSNGSVLNTGALKPSTAYSLSDGDVIKIGELTAMEVRFVSEKVVNEEDSRPKRITRRRAAAEAEAEATGGGQLEAIDEKSELKVGVVEEVVEENKGRGRGRRGRVPKNEIGKKGGGGEESSNLGGNEVKEVKKVVSTRITRSSKRTQDLVYVEEMQNVPLRKTRSSKKAQALTADEKEDADEVRRGGEDAGEVRQGGEDAGEVRQGGEDAGEVRQGGEDADEVRQGGEGLASTSVSRDLDLEKMTIGEWFDYLEEYLPKQIIDQTEEMILEMRQKAEKYHEIVMLHEKGAGK